MADESQNRYGALAARVYHLDKPIGHSFGDVEFYGDVLSSIAGPVFEPAVGSGRVLIPLLERGISISGSDPSNEMLDVCRAECARRGLETTLSVGTFESIPQDLELSAVIIPAGSIQLLTDPVRVQHVFARVRSALCDGGQFVFDLDPLSTLAQAEAPARCWTDGADTLTMTSALERTDYAAQTTVSQLRYELWRNGELQHTELDRFALRFWGTNEVVLALEAAGFAHVELIADYTPGRQVTADTVTTTVIATKSL